MTKSWGAIFDFDGVVVDTEWHHEISWQEVAKEQKKSLTHEQFLSGFGVKNERFISEILGWTSDIELIRAISERKEGLFQGHVHAGSIPLLLGVQDFIESLHEHDVPCAIASSSILKNIDLILNQKHISNLFSHIISGEDVAKGKPNPECFMKAASALKLPPERTIVFEDALLGIEAALKAGCKCVAITTTFDRKEFEELPFKADLIVDSFSELNVRELESWFQ